MRTLPFRAILLMWDMTPQPFPDAGQSLRTDGRFGVPETLNHNHRRISVAGSLDCIRPLGLFVSYGSASGQIDAFNIGLLMQKGSLFATRLRA